MDGCPNFINEFISQNADWIIFKLDGDFQIFHDAIRARVGLYMGDLDPVSKVTCQLRSNVVSGSQLKMFLT